jgi:hypothetical protein
MWIADNPLNPTNSVTVDLPTTGILKTKIICDNLFIFTVCDVRYTNDGYTWKSIVLPWVYHGGRALGLKAFVFDNKIYARIKDSNKTGLFYSSLLS